MGATSIPCSAGLVAPNKALKQRDIYVCLPSVEMAERAGMPKGFIKVLRGDKRRDAIDIYDYVDRNELRQAYLTFMPQLGI